MKRKLLLTLIFIIFFCSFPISAKADAGGLCVTGIDNFSHNYTLTGDGASDIVAVAYAQYQAGKTKSALGYTNAWCAAFINDCALLAGQSDAIPFISGSTHGVRGLRTAVLNRGGREVSSPIAGDLVFYYCTTDNAYAHVALMINGTESIHGNVATTVKKVSRVNDYRDQHGTCYTVTYIRPNYSDRRDTERPVISNIQVTDVSPTGYTISCSVTDNVGVTRVAFPTWTQTDWQDDIVWQDGTISNGIASFRVNASDHGYQRGEYLTYVYAYDAAGNVSEETDYTRLHVYLQEVPDKPVLSVNATNSLNASVFTWNATSNTDFYSIRIYDSGGNRIYLRDDYTKTAFSALLPAGNYQAEVCSVLRNVWVTEGDRVNFTVINASPVHTPELVMTEFLDNKLYKLYSCDGTWLEDKALSEAEGGRLAIIDSRDKQDCIYNMVGYFNQLTYLGAQGYSNYNWLWVDGSVVTGFTAWDDNKPDNYQGLECCMIMYPSNGSWDDCPCEYSYVHGYVAEFDAVSLTVEPFQTPWLEDLGRIRENLKVIVTYADGTGIQWLDGYEMTTREEEGMLIVNVTCAGMKASCEISTRQPDPDFVLPADLTEIGEEAFIGISAEVVSIPEECSYIGHRAFAECPNLRYVIVSDLDAIEIEEDAFEDSDVTIIE